MKTLLLSGIAALFLATGTAHSGSGLPEPEPGWRINCRKVEIWYEGGEENECATWPPYSKGYPRDRKTHSLPEKMRCILEVRGTARHEVARRS
jgi:hypothetical protein